jgi:hypothetical protein
LVAFLALALAPPVTIAQDVTPASAKPAVKTRVITRVFIQSTGDASLRYADLLATEPPTLTPPQRVEGFPELDPARQSLVQMATASGKLMVGVRDDEDGEYQSGWVLIDCGVDEEEHGDHSHWYYNRKPSVLAKRLDDQQGNPAHLYCYDGVFYLANDRSGGFTRLDPAAIPAAAGEELIRAMAAFYPGGGGHITLAAAGKVVYATRMGRDDEGRKIDVTPISASGPRSLTRSPPTAPGFTARLTNRERSSSPLPKGSTGCRSPNRHRTNSPRRSSGISTSVRTTRPRTGPAPSRIMRATSFSFPARSRRRSSA